MIIPNRSATKPACGGTRCPQGYGDDRSMRSGRRPSFAGTHEVGRGAALGDPGHWRPLRKLHPEPGRGETHVKVAFLVVQGQSHPPLGDP